MKVCHICSGFPPAVGGTETHNYSIVKYLSEKGYDIDVIVIRPNRKLLRQTNYDKDIINKILSKNYTEPGLEKVRIHNIFPKPILIYFQIWKKIREIEKIGKIDVFDVHDTLFVLPLNKKRKILLSLHFFELSCPKTNPPLPCNVFSFENCRKCISIYRYIYWRVTRVLTLKKISKIMVKYDFLKNKIIASGVDENKIVVVPYWIDTDMVRKNSKKSVGQSLKTYEYPVFGFLGRLSEFHGITPLLTSFKNFFKISGKGTLILIGNGEMKEKIDDFCLKNGLSERVKVLGRVPYSEVHRYISLADFFLMPSTYDNYGWTLLDIMACEKPIIATNVGGTGDILKDEFNASIAEPTIESLTRKMLEITTIPDLADRIAKNAFKTIQEKHSMRNLERYEELLREI
jgi:glycogen(starch) synthase